MNRPRAVLAAAAGAHFVHDGFADILYVLFPLWASEFGLGLAQVGLIRTAYTGGMAAFQLPAGLLAERWGERRLLVLGTAVTAAGFVAVGAAGGFAALLALLLAAGLASGVQHPLASSLVSRAWQVRRRRAALGTYNFAGDLGKVTVPAAAAVAAGLAGWRAAAAGAGLVGLAAALLILIGLGRLGVGAAPASAARPAGPAASGWGIRDARGFRALAAIGVVDNATRTALLTFLPFVLMGKGLTVTGVGTALALVFAGGAFGKFACGLLAERLGLVRTVVLTEAATAAGIVAVVVAPLPAGLALLLPLGVALNGTSSVLYATVAELVSAERQSRAYGLYYSLAIGASALAPPAYGLVGDAVGAPATVVLIGLVVLVTIPLGLALRGALAQPAGA